MHPDDPSLAAPNLREGVWKGNITGLNGFNLGTFQNDAAFDGLFNGVVKTRFFVLRDDFDGRVVHLSTIIEVCRRTCQRWCIMVFLSIRHQKGDSHVRQMA